MAKKLVAYYRVSTKMQAESGLGLEGQETAVKEFASREQAEILRAYRDNESGKRTDNRPELLKAIAHANRSGATLVIAKLDRLSRNVAFLAGLMETGVNFTCCDNPNANDLTVHILAAVAQDEAKRISERTKAALAAYRARGNAMGAARTDGRRLTPEDGIKGRAMAREVIKARTDKLYADLVPDLVRLRAEGRSYDWIASWLNDEGHTTRRDKPWTATQVLRVLRRFSDHALS